MSLYYVYWIRLSEYVNPFTEGYIGLTKNVKSRWRYHRRSKYIVGDMIRENKSNIHYDIITSVSTLEEAKDIENKYRPAPYIGWNIAKGGAGGYTRHFQERDKKSIEKLIQYYDNGGREIRATTQKEIWKNRNPDDKCKINSMISQTLLSKTDEEKRITKEKRKQTFENKQNVICPYCNKEFKYSTNVSRYHFDNCICNPCSPPRIPLKKIKCEHCKKEYDHGNYKKHHGNNCKIKLLVK